MLLVASFLFNAASNFALGLLLAWELSPAPFGLYALAMAGAGAVAVPLVEWLRHTATRFTTALPTQGCGEVRATIDACALAAGIVLLAGAALLPLVDSLLPLPASVLTPAAIMTVCGALFDVHCALARARFRSGLYATLVCVRSLAVPGAMVATAALTEDPAGVLWAGAAATAVALATARLALRDPAAKLSFADAALALSFARYGLPLVAAGAVALVQAYLNRAAIASAFGLAQAGSFALAWDLGIRVVAVLGTAGDVLLFQRAVRADQTHGPEAASREISRNALVMAALLLPATAGYAAVLPAFEQLALAPAYHGAFAAFSLALLPGFLLWSLMQFAIGPAFQIAGRTTPMLAPMLLALTVNVALALLLPAAWGAVGQAAAFSFGMVPAFLLACFLAWRSTAFQPPWRDLACVALATACMAAVAAALSRSGPPATALPLAVTGGVVAFAVMAWLLDVGGIRGLLRRRLAAAQAA